MSLRRVEQNSLFRGHGGTRILPNSAEYPFHAAFHSPAAKDRENGGTMACSRVFQLCSMFRGTRARAPRRLCSMFHHPIGGTLEQAWRAQNGTSLR